MTDTLFLFTATFPYGNKSETFLETELPILSQHYKNIILVPRYKDGQIVRPIPQNVQILNILWDSPISMKYSKVGLNHILRVAGIYVYTLFQRDNFWAYLLKFKFYLENLLREMYYADRIDEFWSTKGIHSPLCYTYWFEGSVLALCTLKHKWTGMKIVSRTHRYDLLDEVWGPHGKVPFREYKMNHIDKLVCISNHGVDYVKQKVSDQYHSNILLSHLGVAEQKIYPQKDKSMPALIVSCSSLYSFKRVDRIAEVLKYVKSEINWVHFGSGDQLEVVKAKAALLPSNVKWELKGHINNADLLEFYRQNYVDLFISLSENEGLPVTFMEAISFGIPILACAVYGIPDLVNASTGVPIDVNEPVEITGGKIDEILRSDGFDRDAIRLFFRDNFMDKKNYQDFISILDKM